MAFDFERLKSDVFAAGKTAGDKVNEMSQIAKLKLDLKSKEDDLQKKYAELGKAYYEANQAVVSEADMASFDAIAALQAEISRINEELMNVQDSVVCPQCGMKQKKNHAFCSSCGAPLQ